MRRHIFWLDYPTNKKEDERINHKKFTIIIALMLLPTLLSCTQEIKAQQPSVDDWPTFHYDSAHSGYSTSTGPLTNQTLWKFKTGNSVEYSSPSVVNGVAYVGSQDRTFYALNANTGEKIWSFTAGNSIKSIATVVNDVVYVGSLDNNVYALDAKTGNQIWKFKTGNQVYSSPNVVDGVVYIGSNDHYVYALKAEDGSKIWSFQTSNFVWSSPAVVNDVVYVTSWDYVYALEASTGNKIWSFKPKDSMYSSPAVVGGVVYFGSNDHNSIRFGCRKWRKNLEFHNKRLCNIITSCCRGHCLFWLRRPKRLCPEC